MKIRREQLKVDSKKCNGCRECAVACAMMHDGVADSNFSRIKILQFENRDFQVPIICMACENPFCMDVCPMNARVRKSNGTVVTNRENCIGCKACLYVCPAGCPTENPLTGQSMTCDMCEESPDGPCCVKACQEHGALTVCGIDEQITRTARQQASRMKRVFY